MKIKWTPKNCFFNKISLKNPKIKNYQMIIQINFINFHTMKVKILIQIKTNWTFKPIMSYFIVLLIQINLNRLNLIQKNKIYH